MRTGDKVYEYAVLEKLGEAIYLHRGLQKRAERAKAAVDYLAKMGALKQWRDGSDAVNANTGNNLAEAKKLKTEGKWRDGSDAVNANTGNHLAEAKKLKAKGKWRDGSEAVTLKSGNGVKPGLKKLLQSMKKVH